MQVPYWLTYDFPPEVREKLKRQWGSDWKGQAQKWWAYEYCTLLDAVYSIHSERLQLSLGQIQLRELTKLRISLSNPGHIKCQLVTIGCIQPNLGHKISFLFGWGM